MYFDVAGEARDYNLYNRTALSGGVVVVVVVVMMMTV
jgi:hypothetical protein